MMMVGSERPLRGRARIAYEAHRSERTITRWVRRGILPAQKDGPFANSLLEVRPADLARLRPQLEREGD
jgi:hypothetical protein